MKTFYSILYAVIRPETDEKIAIGLILSDGNNSLFEHSKHKLSAIRSLLEAAEYKFIQNYISSIKRTVADSLKNLNQQSIFEFIDARHPIINESYFQYLSIYSSNLVWFSKPLQIDVTINQDVFDKLFNKLVDHDFSKIAESMDLRGVRGVKQSFIPAVFEYFSCEKEVTNEDFSGLITPVTIDLIGKNERMIFAQFVDMERTVREIKFGYYDLKQLKDTEHDSEGFLVSSEPDKMRYIKQHQIWENIRNSKQFNYLDINEVEKIKEYAVVHHVVPFFNE
jgi:hypothetical protein